MSIINEQVKLHPKNTAFQIKAELFTDCPDHAPLMDKLEKEHAVIIIEQRPDGRGLSSVELLRICTTKLQLNLKLGNKNWTTA